MNGTVSAGTGGTISFDTGVSGQPITLDSSFYAAPGGVITFGGQYYFDRGFFDFSGPGTSGNLKLQAVNFGLLAGVPFGANRNSSIFGKLGLLWGHTKLGEQSQNGWGGSYGLGATIGVTRDWAVRLDWDRYRFKLPGGGGDRENVDSLLIGAQYTFGNPR